MATVENSKKVAAALANMKRRSEQEDNVSVVVGYTAFYALFVHEKIEMKWRGLERHGKKPGVYWGPGGQAKFLEGPFRFLSQTLADIVVKQFNVGRSLSQALLMAGLRLQRESQLLVPVVTGHLRASAFTRVDR